jgi:hypothetical protein
MRRYSEGLKDAKRPVDPYVMSHRPTGRVRAKQAWGRVPLPLMVVLALFLAAGPVGLALSRGDARATAPGNTLRDIARTAGCRLQEYENARVTNPPVSGPLVERAIATDGSYIGRATPTVDATTHSLLHGRVLIQYQPGLPEPQVRALDQLVNDDPDRVVGFANQTGMTAPVAATAYLSLLTCPRVTANTLRALHVFRDRRRGFGSAF